VSGTTLIEFQKITKRFQGITALEDVSFKVEKGTIHGLVGENGAGKSTLIKICAGVHRKDAGRIIFEGEEIDLRDPYEAEKTGISVVHQDVPFCPNLSVAGNIFLGDIMTKNCIPQWRKMYVESNKIFKQLGVSINPKKKMIDCSPGERQLTMIARSLRKDAKFIIMDEPTSSLGPEEVTALFNVIKKLKEQGVTFLFVSHRLEEVESLADKVTGLRNGKCVGTINRDEVTVKSLTKLILGDNIKKSYEKKSYEKGRRKRGKPVFTVKNLSNNRLKLNNVSFTLYEKEILGLTGLRGAGKSELMQCIFGIYPKEEGEVYYKDSKVEINSPSVAIKLGLGYLSEDRVLSIYPDLNVIRNMIPVVLRKEKNFKVLKWSFYKKLVNNYIQKLMIHGSSSEKITNLSGGNQQKVLLAKWLSNNPSILILDEPTRGIDIGAKEEIRRLIFELSEQGLSFLVVSSDIDEIMGLADRIMVMNKGKIVKILNRKTATKEEIIFSATKSNF